MPGHPDPRLNLGLTLERAGKLDEAIQAYKTALEVYPGHIPSMQAMAKLEAGSADPGDRFQKRLEEIALAGETEQWRAWARQELARRF